jgi:hypothetical protein
MFKMITSIETASASPSGKLKVLANNRGGSALYSYLFIFIRGRP